MAPGIGGPAESVYKAAVNVLQSHAAVFRLYKTVYEKTQKGIQFLSFSYQKKQ